MRVAHQLAPLITDGLPNRHVIFDTEARRQHTHTGETQTFALAVADYLHWPIRASQQETGPLFYTDPAELWRDVIAFTRSRHRTVVWAHNLAYDLRISRALQELPTLGYQLRGIVLEHQASWAMFRASDRSILCCDLGSWLPTSLAQIARELRCAPSPPLQDSDIAGELAQRCAHDVKITRQAVEQLLQLVQGDGLGPWRATAAGQSHAAWRRRFLTHRPLVHDDESVLDTERRAMWTGRCEAWRWGEIKGEHLHEYDLQLAYPHITAEQSVPARLIGRSSIRKRDAVIRAMQTHSVLAEVTVTTDQPVVPTTNGELIHWPVGTFDTTLWDPELLLLYEAGATVTVRRLWLYERAPVLGEFSRWLLERLRDGSEASTAVQRRALKHMARCVIGRCALRYRSWETYGQVPDFGLVLGELYDLDTGERSELLQVGHELLTLAGETDSEDSLPQITGWVMSEARARLWRLMQYARTENVLYVDTDSIVVTEEGARRLDMAIGTGGAHSLKHKGTHASALILGPRQLQLGRERRLAGVPLTAKRSAPGVYEGMVWRSIRESVTRREGTTVVLERRTWQLQAIDNRRTHLPDGSTLPHQVG